AAGRQHPGLLPAVQPDRLQLGAAELGLPALVEVLVDDEVALLADRDVHAALAGAPAVHRGDLFGADLLGAGRPVLRTDQCGEHLVLRARFDLDPVAALLQPHRTAALEVQRAAGELVLQGPAGDARVHPLAVDPEHRAQAAGGLRAAALDRLQRLHAGQRDPGDLQRLA